MDQLLAGFRLAGFFGLFGLFFTLGIACACRLLGWAPVNITINNHTSVADDPTRPEARNE